MIITLIIDYHDDHHNYFHHNDYHDDDYHDDGDFNVDNKDNDDSVIPCLIMIIWNTCDD